MPGISGTIACVLTPALLATLLCLPCAAAVPDDEEDNVTPVQVLRIPHVAEGTTAFYDYVTTLLSMTLAANADTYGAVRLFANPTVSVQERQLRNLTNRLLDITWSVTSIDRERNFLAIRIPLADGFFGQRVLLIKKDDPRFHLQPGEPQLKAMYALQGYDWPDALILRHNHYKVIETSYAASFKLLAEGFADFYPRSLLEVGFELEKWQSRGITLEPFLLLSYPSAMFFFVNKNNDVLAQRIEEGLLQLKHDGVFARLLSQQAFYQQGQQLATGRHEIVLENPLLSSETRAAVMSQQSDAPDN